MAKPCDQCQAMTINKVYCHEHGCPNRDATRTKPGPTGWYPRKK